MASTLPRISSRALLEFVSGQPHATLTAFSTPQGDAEQVVIAARPVPLERVQRIVEILRTGSGIAATADWATADRLLLSRTHVLLWQPHAVRVGVRLPAGPRRVGQVHINNGRLAEKTLPARWWVLTYTMHSERPFTLSDIRLVVELPGQAGEPGLAQRVAAWPFANVYHGHAGICWGANTAPTTGGPVEVDDQFFGAPFNYDLISDQITRVDDGARRCWRAADLNAILTPYHADRNAGVPIDQVITNSAQRGIPHAQVTIPA